MLFNYLIILARHIGKHPMSYFINFFGLTFGFLACLLSISHIDFEYSYDDIHSKKERIHRVVALDEDHKVGWVKTAAPILPVLKESLPEVEDYVRYNQVSWNESVIVESDGNFFSETRFMMADPSFFQVFDFPILEGMRENLLADPNQIVISESIATKLFGDEEALGQIVKLTDSDLDFQVSGVMANFPENSHIQADYLISFENVEKIFGEGRLQAWNEYNYYAYVLLREGASKDVVEDKVQKITVERQDAENKSFEGLGLQPLEDIHFEHNRGNQLLSYDKKYIYVFFTLAISVLLISLMNYFNLTSMLSLKRVKEVGLRKSFGATNSQLNRQLLFENIVISVFAMSMAALFIKVFRPGISSILDINLSSVFSNPLIVYSALGLSISVGLLAGGYLTFYVSKLKPGDIIKGVFSGGKGRNSFQYILISLQFCLSLILVIGSLHVSRQISLLHSQELGYNYDFVVNIEMNKAWETNKQQQVKNEIARLPLVEEVAFSDFQPGEANWNQTIWWEGQVEDVSMYVMTVGPEFFRAMDINLVEGNYEEIEAITGRREYIINEAARDFIGWDSGKEKLISPFGETAKSPVIAVVEDFNFKSLHSQVEPLVLAVFPERKFSKLVVRLNEADLQSSLASVENKYRELAGGYPFEFSFIDSSLNELYRNEIRLSNIVFLLTFFSVGFALLGIFSLVSFSLERRTKEIAIRKVLGISKPELLKSITSVYLKLVFVSGLIAIPITVYFLDNWLKNFSYRIDVSSFWVILGMLTLFASILVIGVIKMLRVQKINPAQVLKNE